jgi:hypothetical protein
MNIQFDLETAKKYLYLPTNEELEPIVQAVADALDREVIANIKEKMNAAI